jgi:hypothetical protein
MKNNQPNSSSASPRRVPVHFEIARPMAIPVCLGESGQTRAIQKQNRPFLTHPILGEGDGFIVWLLRILPGGAQRTATAALKIKLARECHSQGRHHNNSARPGQR